MTSTTEIRRRPQKERREAAERALIDAAAELIAEGGSAAVTLAKVGARAGYSRGLANHHFGNKADLMARVVEEVNSTFQALIEAGPPAASAGEELRHLVAVYMGVVKNPQAINRARLALIGEAITGDFQFRSVIIESDRLFRAGLANAFERGMAAGDFPADVDPQGLATATIALLRGVACQALTDSALDVDQAYAEIGKLLFGRLHQDGLR